MVLPDDTLVYYLTFNAPGAKNGVRSTLTVVSEHIAIIQKFIDIHLESDANYCIQQIIFGELDDDIYNNIDDYMLKYIKFKNNGSNDTYVIPTTYEIISEVAYLICNDISYVCEFGDIMTMVSDIPIISLLSELIGSMKYSIVKDLQKIDNTGDSTYHENIYNQKNNYSDDETNYDDAIIFDMIEEELEHFGDDNFVMPFNMKSYVKNFTLLLYDAREWW